MAASVVLRASTWKVTDSEVKLNIRLEPQGDGVRQPSDIVCVVDISGSMGTEATIGGAGGEAESHGLSLLDVAKHGVRTIAHALNAEDRLAVVGFHHASKVVFPLTRMDAAGRKLTEARLEGLLPGGGTNIWEGLEKGLECLRAERTAGRFGHVMLLTDGETRDRDAVIPRTMDYKAKYEGLPGSINTFGFGYKLDSRLLVDMARAGMGSYSFIPDAGFVGTAFVNVVSQLLATMTQDAIVTLDASAVEVGQPWGGWKLEDRGDFKCISVGSLQFGQSKDIVVPLKLGSAAPSVVVNASLRSGGGQGALRRRRRPLCGAAVLPLRPGGRAAGDPRRDGRGPLAGEPDDLRGAHQRSCGEDQGLARIHHRERAGVARGRGGPGHRGGEPPRMVLALGRALPALRHVCAPVADLQQLQGPRGAEVRWQLFRCSATRLTRFSARSPRRSPRPRRASHTAAVAPPRRPSAWPAYHNASAGCLDGSSLASLAGGEQRRVADLVRGDRVVGPDGAEAELVCLVRSPCAAGRATLVQLSAGLRLTPYHLVLADGAWRFPADLAEASERPCEAVYSFILKGAPAMCVGGVACVALGHGIDKGAAAHPYLATQKAIDDVARSSDFKRGLVELPLGSVLRDPVTGLICSTTAPESAT